jgi:hypothetical protein
VNTVQNGFGQKRSSVSIAAKRSNYKLHCLSEFCRLIQILKRIRRDQWWFSGGCYLSSNNGQPDEYLIRLISVVAIVFWKKKDTNPLKTIAFTKQEIDPWTWMMSANAVLNIIGISFISENMG